MKKIKAFTIAELAISMLISGIVISIAYYAFFLFNTQFNKYKRKSAIVNDFLLFQTVLNKDMNEADRITDSAGFFIILENPGNERITRYEMSEDHITRYAGEAIDSFSIRPMGFHMETVDDKLPLIRKIVFSSKISTDMISAIFVKRYSAQQLMNEEHHAHE